MELIDKLISPLKDEGIKYIWFAKYNDNSFKYESDESKNRSDFDSVYKDRDKIKEFGLIGEGKKISYQTNSGLININDDNGNYYDNFHFSLSTDIGIINITNNPDTSYTDFTARKYVHTDVNLGQEVYDVIPEVGPIAFGYTTIIKCSESNKVKIEILYLVYEDHEEIKVSLTPEQDLEGNLTFRLANSEISGSIRINIKKNQRSEFKLRI